MTIREGRRLSFVEDNSSAWIDVITGGIKMIVKVQRYVMLGVVSFMWICGVAYGATGGSVDGLDLGFVKCKNRDNNQSVRLYPQRVDWDCEAAGMQVGTGAEVAQLISGKALGSKWEIHGAVVGITNIKALYCRNRSTGKASSLRNPKGVTWSCRDAGLRVFAGNRVDVVIVGFAQGSVPPAPSGLSVKAGAGQALLSWDAIPDAIHYNVYMSTESPLKLTNETLQSSVAENSFAATGLVNDSKYYFAVTAENAYGEGNPSREVSVIPGYFDHSAVSARTCAECHDGTSATSKPANHPVTTDLCQACHSTTEWRVVSIDHLQIREPCANCHNQSPTHPLTTSVCEGCHSATAWIPLILPMDHSQTTDNCVRCHDNVLATGKPVTHIASSDQCELCHSTSSFLVLGFDHSIVAGQSCAQPGCHNGISAVTAKPPTHPVTTNNCEVCHNTVAWLPLVLPFDHTQTADACLTCHNGAVASGKSTTHPLTTDQCESCHTLASWLQLILPFDHSHVITPSCSGGGCHSQSEMGANHCATTEDCSACHTTTVWIDAQPCGASAQPKAVF